MTLDTRGWAIKNVDVNLSVPEVQARNAAPSDRLVGSGGVPRQMPVVDVHAADDILDEKHNPTAQKFDALMQKAADDRRHSLLSTLKGLVDIDEKPHQKKAKHKSPAKAPVKAVASKELPATRQALTKLSKEAAAERARRKAEEDAEIAQKLEKARASFSAEFEGDHIKVNPHHRLFGSRAQMAAQPTPAKSAADSVTAARRADNMELAQSGSAFSVSTLSQLANRQNEDKAGPAATASAQS